MSGMHRFAGWRALHTETVGVRDFDKSQVSVHVRDASLCIPHQMLIPCEDSCRIWVGETMAQIEILVHVRDASLRSA